MDSYYVNQAGSGISGFAGVRYQRGDGFLGRLWTGGILPIIKKALPLFSDIGKQVGKRALSTGLDIAQDVLDEDDVNMATIKESAKKRLKQGAKAAGKDTIAHIRSLTGVGLKRRKHRVRKGKGRKKYKKYRTQNKLKKIKRNKRKGKRCYKRKGKRCYKRGKKALDFLV